jgi:hypothetical protein
MIGCRLGREDSVNSDQSITSEFPFYPSSDFPRLGHLAPSFGSPPLARHLCDDLLQVMSPSTMSSVQDTKISIDKFNGENDGRYGSWIRSLDEAEGRQYSG